MYKILTILGAIALMLAVLSTAPAKADTLICERASLKGHISPMSVTIFSTSNKGITDVDARTAFSTVTYQDKDRNDRRVLYLNAKTFTCHEIRGNNDRKEEKLVKELYYMITKQYLDYK